MRPCSGYLCGWRLGLARVRWGGEAAAQWGTCLLLYRCQPTDWQGWQGWQADRETTAASRPAAAGPGLESRRELDRRFYYSIFLTVT